MEQLWTHYKERMAELYQRKYEHLKVVGEGPYVAIVGGSWVHPRKMAEMHWKRHPNLDVLVHMLGGAD